MNAGYVYVIAFDNGLVKVGQTKNAPARFNAHRQAARNFGLTVTDRWESPLHRGWLENERALKRIAVELGGKPTTPEYFSGVNFEALTEKARELPFESPDAAPAVQKAAPAGKADVAAPRDSGLRHDPTIRFLMLQRMARTNDEVKILAASMFLDMGMAPQVMRHDLGYPYIADVMEQVLHEEARIRQAA